MRFIATLCLLVAAAVVASGQQPKRPRITGIAHFAFYVHDVEKARAFYRDLLGFDEAFPLKNEDGSLSMTFFKVNDRQYLEVFPEREPKSDRLAHIGIEVDDAEAMRVYLNARGVAVPAKVNTGRVGNRSFSVTDPDGHSVEFVQYEPTGLPAKARGALMGGPALSRDMRHVGILVGALEPATRFYGDVLGFKEIWRGSRDGKELNWVNMQVPDGETYVEFMLYRDLPEPTRRGSQHHIALFVPDISKVETALKSLASKTGYSLSIEVRTGINRKRQLNVFDPDGTRTEFMEPQTIDGTPAPSSNAPPPK
jgi:catechol 2,3-dioxygenase-like lactoylglutathione lyase family enzyme